MFNPIEQPWLLIICAVILLIATLIYRKIFPEKFTIWHWCIPLVVFALAFGLYYYVETDKEKIEHIIQIINKTAETENCDLIAPYISEDYSDPRNRSKSVLLNKCRARLEPPLIRKSVSSLLNLDFGSDRNTAQAVFTIRLSLDPESRFYQYQPIMLLKFELSLKRNQQGKWVIQSGKLLELNNRKADWSDIF
jgi:hypothetical protein